MVTIFMVNEDIARGMVCFFHQKKHSYLINFYNAGVVTHDPGANPATSEFTATSILERFYIGEK
jgi:hypothetical protein